MLKTASIQTVENELRRLQSNASIRWLDQGARTAQQAATSLGVAVGQIAKSIIFRHPANNRHILVVTAGDRRVDINKVSLAIESQETVLKADADFVKAQSGFVIGGVSPIAHLKPPITLIDASLARFQQLWAAAGHAHAVFPLTFTELCIWLNVTPCDLTEPISMNNATLFSRAQNTCPGGVNSPVRAFRAVGGTPRFIARAQGAHVFDVEGKRYIDYIGSWGPMIVGHAHPRVIEAVQHAAKHGLSFGCPTEVEVEFAELLCTLVPSMDMVRLVSSGTEATMSAIRLARAATGRDLFIKFDGCYHGHADSLLIKAGSGLLTFGTPTSGGVPQDIAKHTLVLPFNDEQALAQAFAEFGAKIAAVIVEPIAGNMNFVRGDAHWLTRMRDLCSHHGSVLIFDEVMCGFRVALECAQGLYQITPDLTVLGKVIGGGMPLAAFGGKKELMRQLSPLGPVYQAGTLSGNPIAIASGLETLALIKQPEFFKHLSTNTRYLIDGLCSLAKSYGIPFQADAEGGMFGFAFCATPPKNLLEMQATDTEMFKRFFHLALEQGIYFAPSAFEAGFVSSVHDKVIIEETLSVCENTFKQLA